jgi:hypothetical protein
MFAINEVLRLVKSHEADSHLTRILLGDANVCIGSRRLRTFLHHGTDCLHCGLKGEGFVIVAHSMPGTEDITHHSLQLFGTKDGERVWLTRDHVQSRALGGLDSMVNSQTLCQTCNQAKGLREKEVLDYLRELCGLSEWGADTDGHYPHLTRTLIHCHLDIAWQEAAKSWDWASPVPVKDQLRPLLEGELMAEEELKKASDQLAHLAATRHLSEDACRRWLNAQGKRFSMTPAQQGRRAPASQLGLSSGGYAVFCFDHAQAQTRLLREVQARRSFEANLVRRQFDTDVNRYAHEMKILIRKKEKQQAATERQEAERLRQKALSAKARHQKVITHEADASPAQDSSFATPAGTPARLLEYQTDMALLAGVLGVSVAEYREGCEHRAPLAKVETTTSETQAKALGMTLGALAVFVTDRATCMTGADGIEEFRRRWAHRHSPDGGLLGPKARRRLKRLELLAEFRNMSPDGYRRWCEEAGARFGVSLSTPKRRATAAALGLTIQGLLAFQTDYEAHSLKLPVVSKFDV